MLTGKAIRDKRKALRLSAEELAKRLNVSKDNLYKWEKGHMPSNPVDYTKLEKWLAGSLEYVPEEKDGHAKDVWKDKYITLLEKQTELLNQQNLVELSLRNQKAMMEVLAFLAEQVKGGHNKIAEILKKYGLPGIYENIGTPHNNR